MVSPIWEWNAKVCLLVLLPLEGKVSRNHFFQEESSSFLAKTLTLPYFRISFLGHTSTKGLLGLFSTLIC